MRFCLQRDFPRSLGKLRRNAAPYISTKNWQTAGSTSLSMLKENDSAAAPAAGLRVLLKSCWSGLQPKGQAGLSHPSCRTQNFSVVLWASR